MSLVFSDAGERTLLEWCFKSAGENLTLKLFSNDADTPDGSSVAADFTVCTFTGYSDKTLTRATFGAATTDTGTAEISYPELSWTASSTETVYGYAIFDASGNYLGAEKFAAVENMTSGKTLTLTPTFTLATAT